MGTELLEEADVTAYNVRLKFAVSVRTASITNSKFVVTTDEATPVVVSDPFETIDLGSDYNTVSRTLTLQWKDDALEPLTDYVLTISDLENVLGQDIADGIVEFSTGDTVNSSTDGLPPAPTPVSIIDHSVISTVYDSLVAASVSTSFEVDSIDPINGDYYLPADYKNGRITITFTKAPAVSSVNERNFKVQRKPISRSHSRWEDLEVQVSSSGKKVYVDIPSVDYYPEAATPSTEVVYYTDGYEYYSENYKYRLIISKNVAT